MIIFCLWATDCLASKIGEWKAELSKETTQAFALKVALLEKMENKKEYVFADVDHEKFNKLGFLATIDSRAGNWALKLNHNACMGEDFLSKKEGLDFIASVAQSELLVLMGALGKAFLVKNSGGKTTKVDSLKKLEKSPEDIYKKIENVLGFNGIILDVRKNKLLVQGSSYRFKPRRQAVVIQNSKSEIVFPEVLEEAEALIELVEHEENYAIYKIIVASEGVRIEPGLKIRSK